MNDKRKEIIYQLPTPDKLHTLRAISRLQEEDAHNRHNNSTVSKRFSSIVEHHVYIKGTNESIVYRANDRNTGETDSESQIKHNKYSPKSMKTFCQTSIPHCSKDKYFMLPGTEYAVLDHDQYARVTDIKKTDEPSIVEHCDSTTDLCIVKNLRSAKEISPEPKISTTLNNNDERLYVANTNKNFDDSTYKSSETDKISSIYEVVETEQSVMEHGRIISTPLRTYYLNPFAFLKLNQESQDFSRRNAESTEYHNIASLKKPLSEMSDELCKALSIDSSLDVSPCESTLKEIKTSDEKVAMWKVDFDNAQNNDYVDFCEADCLRVNERILNEKRIHLNKLRLKNLNSDSRPSSLTNKNIYNSINVSTQEESDLQADSNYTSSADKSEIVISSDTTNSEQNEHIEKDGDLYEIAPGIVVRLPKSDTARSPILSPVDDAEIIPKLEKCKQLLQKNACTSPLSLKSIANISGSKSNSRKEYVLNSIGNCDMTDVRYTVKTEKALSPKNKFTITKLLPKNLLTKAELRYQVSSDLHNLSLKNSKTNSCIMPDTKTHAETQSSKENNCQNSVFTDIHSNIDVISISSESSLKDYANVKHSTPKSNVRRSKSSERSKTPMKTPVKLISNVNNITERLRTPVKVLFDMKNSLSDKKFNRNLSTQKGFDKKRDLPQRNNKRKQNDMEPPSPETTERNEFYSYLQIITKPLRKDGTPVIKNRRSVRVRNLEINKQRDSEEYNAKGGRKGSADKRDKFKKVPFIRKRIGYDSEKEKSRIEYKKSKKTNKDNYEMKKYISSIFPKENKKKKTYKSIIENMKKFKKDKNNKTPVKKLKGSKSDYNSYRDKLQNSLSNRSFERRSLDTKTKLRSARLNVKQNILKRKYVQTRSKNSINEVKKKKNIGNNIKKKIKKIHLLTTNKKSLELNSVDLDKPSEIKTPLDLKLSPKIRNEILLKRSIEQAMVADSKLTEHGFTYSEVTFSKHISKQLSAAINHLQDSYNNFMKGCLPPKRQALLCNIDKENDDSAPHKPLQSMEDIEKIIGITRKRKMSDTVVSEVVYKKSKSCSTSSQTTEKPNRTSLKAVDHSKINLGIEGPVTRLSFAAMEKTLTRSSHDKLPKLNLEFIMQRMKSNKQHKKVTKLNHVKSNENNSLNNETKSVIERKGIDDVKTNEDSEKSLSDKADKNFKLILSDSESSKESINILTNIEEEDLDVVNNLMRETQTKLMDHSTYMENEDGSSFSSDDTEYTFKGFGKPTTEDSQSDTQSDYVFETRPGKLKKRSYSLPAYFEKERVEKFDEIFRFVYNGAPAPSAESSENINLNSLQSENRLMSRPENVESVLRNSGCLFNTESISRCPSPPFIPLSTGQPLKSLLRTFSKSIKNKQDVPCQFGTRINTELSELFNTASNSKEHWQIPALRQLISDKIQAREERLGTGITLGKKRLGEHEIHIVENNGIVLDVYFIDNVLIIVQEFTISFWQQTSLGTILGTQNMWLSLGSIQRLKLEQGCVNKRAFSQMVTSVENAVAYIELWTKEHKSERRERPIADVFATVYFYQNKKGVVLDKKVIQLENIKGSEQDVQYVVLRSSRCILVSWHDPFKMPPISLIRKYTLASDFQTVSSVAEVESVNHYISSLHNVQECTGMVLGIGEQHISIWDLPHGQLISTVSLESSNTFLNTNLLHPINPEINCVWALCDRGFLFLLQKTENESLQLIAIKGLRNDWKQLQTYRIPTGCIDLRGISVKGGILTACYAKHVVCWALQTGTLLLKCSSGPDNILFPSQRHIATIDSHLNVTVKHIMAYLLED